MRNLSILSKELFSLLVFQILQKIQHYLHFLLQNQWLLHLLLLSPQLLLQCLKLLLLLNKQLHVVACSATRATLDIEEEVEAIEGEDGEATDSEAENVDSAESSEESEKQGD